MSTVTVRNLVADPSVAAEGILTAFSRIDQSDGFVAMESHDLFDAVPVGFVQFEVAQGGAWFETHHALSAHGGMAVGLCRHLILSRIQHAPVIAGLT